MAGNRRQRGGPSDAGGGPGDGLRADDLESMFIEAKLEILTLIRALDAVGVNPSEHAVLAEALGNLAELDNVLTSTIEFLDRQPPPDGEPVPDEMRTLLGVQAEIMECVLKALPPETRKQVIEAWDQGAASEVEIWSEVDAFRAEARLASSGPPAPEHFEEERRAVAEAFQGAMSGSRVDARVVRQESKALSQSGDVRAWLGGMPKNWLQRIARSHRVPRGGNKAALVARIADALFDPLALAAVFRDELSRNERVLLALLARVDPVPFWELAEEVVDGLAVPWNWADDSPAGTGARLRMYGLLHVGRQGGETVAGVPYSIQDSVLDGMELADPELMDELDARLGEDTDDAAVEHGDEVDDVPRAHPRPSTKPAKVYVLDVELMDSAPAVTRRICVSGRRSLGDLHEVLQRAMGWDDSHLHVFMPKDGAWKFADPRQPVEGAQDENAVALDEVAPRKGSRFFYEYDFGDSWIHEIRVVDRLEPRDAGPEPLCLGGSNACPPEDSGGVAGYAWKLEVLADPRHADYEEIRDWIGPDFDATHFDPVRVNRALSPRR